MFLSTLSIVNQLLNMIKDEKRAFSLKKLKLVKALLFDSFYETEAPGACYCFM